MRWDVVLERSSQKKLNPEVTRKKLRRIAGAAERNKSPVFAAGSASRRAGTRHGRAVPARGLPLLRPRPPRTACRRRARRRRQPNSSTSWGCCRGARAVKAGGSSTAAGTPWMRMMRRPFCCPSGSTARHFRFTALTDEVMKTFFAGIYERQRAHPGHPRLGRQPRHQPGRVEEGQQRGGRPQPHPFEGEAGGGEDGPLQALKKWYEEASPGAERVTFVDTHCATRAGVENWLLERAEQGELADIVVFEELEKLQPLDNLLPLVSVMGNGYIAKLNAWVGHRKELANILVFATCNDEVVIRKWRNGAIWSRFTKKIHCARPSQGRLMLRILLDTVQRVGGDPAWAEKAMEFAYDIMPQVVGYPLDDPREIKGLLDGRERFETGAVASGPPGHSPGRGR